jgi:hypothetical protein
VAHLTNEHLNNPVPLYAYVSNHKILNMYAMHDGRKVSAHKQWVRAAADTAPDELALVGAAPSVLRFRITLELENGTKLTFSIDFNPDSVADGADSLV